MNAVHSSQTGSGVALTAEGMLVAAGGAIALMLPLILQQSGARLWVFTLLTLVFLIALFKAPRTGMVSMIIYLMFLGDIRRYLDFNLGSTSNDPLLLVVPTVVGLGIAMLMISKRLKVDTLLSKCMAIITGMLFVWIINPLQGGIAVGIGGAILLIPPLLWFWLGKLFATPSFSRSVCLYVVIPFSTVSALYGIYQSFFGYLPYQREWLERAGWWYVFKMADGYRPMGFSINPSEYASFIIISIGFCIAGTLSQEKWTVIALPVFFGALFLLVSQGPLAKVFFMFVAIWAILPRNRLALVPRAAVAAAVGIVVFAFVLPRVQDAAQGTAVEKIVHSQTDGILNVRDGKKSNAGVHASMIKHGIISGFTNPIGKGTGAATLAGSKYGTGGGSSEFDLSDMFIRLGFIGGGLYGLVVIICLMQAVQGWRETRNETYLYIFALLICTVGSWLAFGKFAQTAITWMLIGSMDGMRAVIKSENSERSN